MSRDITTTDGAVAADVRYALELLRDRYGADDYDDSRTNTVSRSPTRIVKLRKLGAEVGVPLNAEVLSIYLRSRTLDGRHLTSLLAPEVLERATLYPRDGKPARSIAASAYFRGGCIRLSKLQRDEMERVLETFFAIPTSTVKEPPLPPAEATAPRPASTGVPIDAEAFDALLERRTALGQAGEQIALQDELARLSRLGCLDPERWVECVALSDVGLGYDIASTWPGQERCIEVKSTSALHNAFFVTRNERRVLAALGEQAWLYRVVVQDDGVGAVRTRLQNPMQALPEEAFVPEVFWVAADAVARVGTAEEAADG